MGSFVGAKYCLAEVYCTDLPTKVNCYFFSSLFESGDLSGISE